MDWRFNTIWFDKIEKEKFYSKDFKEKRLMSECSNTCKSEYAILWHLKEKEVSELNSFQNLKYLELNWSNVRNFNFFKHLKSLDRLHLECCIKLESDEGLSLVKESLQSLYVGKSKKFHFKDDLLQLEKLRVLALNDCGAIDDLHFLNYFPNLISFRFVNTNIKSGDLRPILEHKTIKSVGFLNKRHYNFKNSEIEQLLTEKDIVHEEVFEYKDAFKTFRYNYE